MTRVTLNCQESASPRELRPVASTRAASARFMPSKKAVPDEGVESALVIMSAGRTFSQREKASRASYERMCGWSSDG